MSDNSRPSPVIQTNSTVPRTQSSTTSGGGTGTNGRPVGLMLDFVSSVSADATQSSGTLSRKQPTMMRPIEQHIRTSSLTSVVPNNSSNPTQQLGSTSNVQVGFGLLGGHETGLSSPGAGWVSITEKVAPLFQGRGLKGSIDELNELVRWDMCVICAVCDDAHTNDQKIEDI